MHLDRAAVQPCDRCGNFSCAQCLGAVGRQWFCVACRARAAELEWDRRKELGLFRAWWLTTRRLIVAPLQTLEVISPDGTIVESSIYAGLSTLVGFLPTLVGYGAIIGGMMVFGSAGKDNKLQWPAATAMGVFVFVFYVGFLVAGSIAFMLLSAGLELLVLRLGGKREASYSVSVRAHALSMAAYAIGVVPLCSVYVFPIWSIVLRVFAIQKLQRTTAGAGAASAVIPLVLCCGAGATMYGLLLALTFAKR